MRDIILISTISLIDQSNCRKNINHENPLALLQFFPKKGNTDDNQNPPDRNWAAHTLMLCIAGLIFMYQQLKKVPRPYRG